MREILFRGKRVDNGEWVYGAYEPPVEWGGRKWDVSIATVTEYGWLEDIAVIPETVGQFTGLTDKNGTKIFEGDIIKLAQSGKCYAVKYKSGCFCIGINWAISHEPDCEVIGNIHDNPELLEGE